MLQVTIIQGGLICTTLATIVTPQSEFDFFLMWDVVFFYIFPTQLRLKNWNLGCKVKIGVEIF